MSIRKLGTLFSRTTITLLDAIPVIPAFSSYLPMACEYIMLCEKWQKGLVLWFIQPVMK